MRLFFTQSVPINRHINGINMMDNLEITQPIVENLEDEWQNNGRLPDSGAEYLDYRPNDLVLSCSKLESGLRLGHEAIRACCMGAIVSPMYWSAKQASEMTITKEMIIEKRKLLFKALNDENSGNISCKRCDMVRTKKFKDVSFAGLGHVNLAHFSMCNLRCNFCGFTQHNSFLKPQYDALAILKQFEKSDVEWDSLVDLNGGEPTLLKDLDDYIHYFTSRGVRILMYTNAVRYNQAIYDGLLNGSITWLITSLDAGTPSSFKNIKGRDYFVDVMENLTRYAKAGSDGLGNLAVKYIFSADNCSDDDIAGFTYSMLAIRPQKVWLTFDFFPLADKYEEQEEVGVYDYSKHIDAYIKMFLMFKKHGLEPAHFAEKHLAQVLQTGKDLIESVQTGIEEQCLNKQWYDPGLLLEDFRKTETVTSTPPLHFKTEPLTIIDHDDVTKDWDLTNKRVLLAPAYDLTKALLQDEAIGHAHILGFLDRNPVLHDKNIKGYNIYPYEKIEELKPEVVLIASPEQHKTDIVATLNRFVDESTEIAVYEGVSSPP